MFFNIAEAFANESEQDLFSLTLEQLLNIKIVSKESESLVSSPGVTNVLDDEVMHPDIYNLSTRKVQAEGGIGFLVGFNYEPGY
tara:strand:- start:1189 stop:1440 length:252 start_codon:yes stop_codon:yes gene_type:complete